MTKKMSVQDAATWIYKSLTVEYRRLCLAHWRKVYGDQYTDEVELVARKLFLKKGKK